MIWLAVAVCAPLAVYLWVLNIRDLRQIDRVCGGAERLDLEVELRRVAAIEAKP